MRHGQIFPVRVRRKKHKSGDFFKKMFGKIVTF